jgi:sensor domain CHASE-containing protein
MSFRRKLLLVFSVSVALSVAAVAWLVQEVTRKAFEETENQRTSQLVGQFQREFNRQGEEVTRRVENIAA